MPEIISRCRTHTSDRQASQGQALLLFALALTVLMGFVALSVDAGFLMAERRQVQSAADAGALAGAIAVRKQDGSALAAASDYATTNAGDGASASASLTGGPVPGMTYVRVTVTKDVDRFFLGAIYTGPWRVEATALAGVELEPADYALVTLEKQDEPGIYLNGNTGIILSGGRASAMSNTSIRGSNNTSFQAPGYIDAHTTIQSGSGWTTSRASQPQIEDPLVSMTRPSTTGRPSRTLDCPKKGTCYMDPGVYANQSITVSDEVVMRPGVYYFQNTDIGLQNSKSTLSGTGVTLYFDSNSSFDPKNGIVALSAPNSTPWSGARSELVFWYAACNTIDIQGGAGTTFSGIFYAPCAHVQMHGNPSNDTIDGQIIVNTFEVKGTSDLRISYRRIVEIQRPEVYLVE